MTGFPDDRYHPIEILGISRQAVDKRRASNQLLALTQGKRGYSYPSFQFEDGKTITGIEEDLAELKDLDPWMQMVFFTGPMNGWKERLLWRGSRREWALSRLRRRLSGTKLLAEKPIADADFPRILLVVRFCGGSPISIEDATERQPRTTLYLLRPLSQAAKDPKISISIEKTAVYVKSQYATYLRTHPNE